ncbi:hypothetical protein ACFOWZ_25180, partial [Lentzea rhizosphaerae]
MGDRETMKTQPVALLSSEAKGVGSFKPKAYVRHSLGSSRCMADRDDERVFFENSTACRNTASNMNT